MITPDGLQELFRHDIPDLMIAGVFVASGLAAIVLHQSRERKRDRALLWFGLFSLLYGIRLVGNTDAIRDAFAGLNLFWAYLDSVITYVILLPIVLLLWEIFPTWRRVLRPLLWGMAVFAAAGLISDAVQKEPRSLTRMNSAIVLLTLVAFLGALFRRRTQKAEMHSADIQTLRIGLLTFSLALAVNNLGSLLGRRLPFNPEPLGLLVLLVALGRVLARRASENQDRLLELDKELDIARRIQTSILPREMPAGPNWDIAARYLPMTAVAGDFYDFLIVDEQRAGILVADVSGHGVPAALIASMVKVAIAAQLADAAHPAKVLSGMNHILCGKLQGQYVTAAYLYIDLTAGKMRYAAAAHPALLWYHAAGQVEAVLENGLMLGLFPEADYTERESGLRGGDRFLLYTDGLVEAANEAGEFFGDERAIEVLTETGSETAQETLTVLLDRVVRWSDTAQDDLTLVAVGRRTAS